MPRYITKSLFKTALGCPTKLFFSKKEKYPDAKLEDTFLEALAEGGYQVGELAKCYFPNGTDIKDRGYDTPLTKTNELLEQENVIIYEAAFKYQNLFIRADILEKSGKTIKLYEVKSKSFSGRDSGDMLNRKGFIDSGWREYVYDVAFQKYVITKAFPDWKVNAYLTLANKNSVATVDGLNQKFQIIKEDGRITDVEIIGGVTEEDLGDKILININVDDLLETIYDGTDFSYSDDLSFSDYIHFLADHYEQDEKIVTPINKDCQSCEFKASPEEELEGKLSGFKECWSSQLGWVSDDFNKPLIFDVWNLRKKQALIEEGIYTINEIQKEHLGDIVPNDDCSMSSKERQWLQIEKVKNNDVEPYIDVHGLKTELNSFAYPLHFIDFETSMVAIPFFTGRKPYEQTAFQFSHHVVYEDGTIEHVGQYLSKAKGEFPNFNFIRALKKELENDEGTIFRYAAHENTVLNQIHVQLQDSSDEEVPDKQELIDFICLISHSANHQGERDMVDMLQLVKDYYYHPLMVGSNSIKAVLPAVLNSSDHIQQKYSQPIYGKNSEIKSLNFEDGKVWIEHDENGQVISPYKLLEPLFDELNEDQIEEFLMRNNIADGGAAMTAYAMLQFTNIPDVESKHIHEGLLKYCELDTLAMVLIWEYWNSIVQ